MCQSEWAKQAKAVDRMVEEVEGEDDRDYEPEIESKKIRQVGSTTDAQLRRIVCTGRMLADRRTQSRIGWQEEFENV